MEIYFNELSILPKSISIEESRDKIVTLIQTIKALQEHDFTILRSHDNFYSEDLGLGYTCSKFVNDLNVANNLRVLLLSIVKNPFLADEDSNEAEMFVVNKFESINHEGGIVSPEGIAISYVCEVPTISFSGYPLWSNESIFLKVYNTRLNTYDEHNIINLSTKESLQNNNFKEWIKNLTVDIQLNSYDNIIKHFPVDTYEFDARAISEIIAWYYDDKRYIIKIKKLIEDIRNAPFVGGYGLTENLGGGKGSKRIVKKDRVVYTVLDEKIIIHSCRKHYDDK